VLSWKILAQGLDEHTPNQCNRVRDAGIWTFMLHDPAVLLLISSSCLTVDLHFFFDDTMCSTN